MTARLFTDEYDVTYAARSSKASAGPGSTSTSSDRGLGTATTAMRRQRLASRHARFATGPVLSLNDVAAELAISHSQAYALVRSRELPAIQVSGRGQWRASSGSS